MAFPQKIRSDSISSTSSIASFLPKNPFGIGDSQNLEWKQDNKCHICMKKFGLGARHHCRYCGNSVCKLHSIVKNLNETQEKTRICDVCDVELIKSKIRGEIMEELAGLQDNIEIAKEAFAKADAERYEKSEKVMEIERILMDAEKMLRKKEEDLLKRLAEEQGKSKENDEFLDCITKNLDVSHKNEKEMTKKFNEVETATEELKNEVVRLKANKSELAAELEHITGKINNSLPISLLSNNLCDPCKQRCIGERR